MSPLASATGLAQPPELVVFDVDGTLHDTFAWWPEVLRRGLAKLASERGLDIDPPDDDAACAVVGKRDAEVWAPFLPEGAKDLWPELRATVIPLECEVLRGGDDHLYPGVRALLPELRGIGVRVAIASNCRSGYFEAVRFGLGLTWLSDWQFCLDSPGISDKTAMVAAAMDAAGTRHAVVVGDREADCEAARTNGLPFIWRRSPFCDLAAQAVAVWDGDPQQLWHQLHLPGPPPSIGGRGRLGRDDQNPLN